MILKLNDDSNDYENCLNISDELLQVVNFIKAMLTQRQRQLTRLTIHEEWPRESRPGIVPLWRHQDRGLALDELVRNGSGLRDDPFRYTLPGVEFPWRMELVDKLAQIPY